MNLADLARDVGRPTTIDGREVADIITFIESAWGLGFKLFPVQRVILKAHYGEALDDNEHGFPLDVPIPLSHPNYDPDLVDRDGFYKLRVVISDWRRQNYQHLTEAGYLRYLYDDGRCNIREVIPGQERREMILSVGRRSGKTSLSACVAAYETYKLLLKGDPQSFYGLPHSNVIQLISVATDKDQAGLLYREVSGHFTGNCEFFSPYMANNTMSYANFQTPYDIEQYGTYAEDPKARSSIKVTFRSCVAKGLRGAGNILVILDEVAHFTDAGQSGADAVYQAVTPSTSAYSPKDPDDARVPIGEVEGRIILISSPLGKTGLFYDQYRIGFSGSGAADNMLCVQAPTWEVNPTIPAHEFEKHYLKDVRVFFTEYGAHFSDRTRGWIEDENDLLACVLASARPRFRGTRRVPHFLGFDLGLVDDASAVAIGHVEEGQVVVDLVDAIQAGVGKYAAYDRLKFDWVADWIHELSKRFYIVEGLFDQWAGIPLEQALEKRGLRQMQSEHFSKPLNSAIFRNFYNMMIDNRLVLYNWPPMVDDHGNEGHCPYIAELLTLQAEFQSKYITLVEAPPGPDNHDDMSDALVRMVWCASQAMGKNKHLAVGQSNRLAGGQRGPSPGSLSRARRKALLGGTDLKRMDVRRARAGGMSPYKGFVMVSNKKRKK